MSTRTVKDVMSSKPICIGRGHSIRELAQILVENEISGVPVVDGENRVLGVVSKTDLLSRCISPVGDSGSGSIFTSIAEGLEIDVDLDEDDMNTVEDCMSPDPVTASPDESIDAVCRRMAKNRVHRVIVVDEEQRVVGVVTALDVIGAWPASRSR